MEFVVSRDPRLSPGLLWPSSFTHEAPKPVPGRVTSYHFLARNALYHGLRAMGLQRGDKVLVPAFHCGTVIEPVLQFGCEVVFYNVNRDGVIDFDDLAQRVDGHTKAIIAIHYFGRFQPVQQLQYFCHQHRILFIEDCAHILMGEIEGQSIGSFGDISIFSWRKFFPMFDGGLLVRNRDGDHSNIDWEKVNRWSQVKIVKNLLEKCFFDYSSPTNLEHLLTQASKKTALNHHENQSGERSAISLTAPLPEFDTSRVNWPMSSWSCAILRNSDVGDIVKRRKENSNWLSEEIKSLAGVSSWRNDGDPTTCTWAFPLYVPGRNDVHVRITEKRGSSLFLGRGHSSNASS